VQEGISIVASNSFDFYFPRPSFEFPAPRWLFPSLWGKSRVAMFVCRFKGGENERAVSAEAAAQVQHNLG
jgi:hypothetical protein